MLRRLCAAVPPPLHSREDSEVRRRSSGASRKNCEAQCVLWPQGSELADSMHDQRRERRGERARPARRAARRASRQHYERARRAHGRCGEFRASAETVPCHAVSPGLRHDAPCLAAHPADRMLAVSLSALATRTHSAPAALTTSATCPSRRSGGTRRYCAIRRRRHARRACRSQWVLGAFLGKLGVCGPLRHRRLCSTRLLCKRVSNLASGSVNFCLLERHQLLEHQWPDRRPLQGSGSSSGTLELLPVRLHGCMRDVPTKEGQRGTTPEC